MALTPMLWLDSKQKFVPMGESAGGITISAENVLDNGLTSGQIVEGIYDSSFNSLIKGVTGNNDITMISYDVDGLDEGLYSIEIRMSIDPLKFDPSFIIGSFRSYYISGQQSQLLATTNIFGSYFDEEHSFAVLGFIINYSRNNLPYDEDAKLKINLSLKSQSNIDFQNVNVFIDYIKIAPAMPGVTAIPTLSNI